MNRFLEQLDDTPPFDFSNYLAYGKIDDIEAIPGEPSFAMAWFNLIAINSLYKCGLQRKHHVQVHRELASFDENPYEEAVIFRIEIKLHVSREYSSLDEFLLSHQDKWYIFKVRDPGKQNGNSRLYTNLFTTSIPSQVRFDPVDPDHQKMLNREFSLDTAEKINMVELQHLIAQSTPGPQFLAAYDVGQGNSNALIGDSGGACPDIYFDVGAAVGPNKSSKPGLIDFCFSKQPLIIMSHWDHDHWAGACPKENKDSDALKMNWIVTNQILDPIHKTFAMEVINKKGRIRVLDMPVGDIGQAVLNNKMSIRFTLGNGRTRNDSGIVLSIENNDPDFPACWLLTGDCDYKYFLDKLKPPPAVAVIAPHHGANLKATGTVPIPVQSGYRRLVYSFGRGNKYRHPTPKSVERHKNAGWDVGTWSTAPGGCVKTADICATADNAVTGSYRGGVLIGWEALTSPLPNCLGCSCNTTLVNH